MVHVFFKNYIVINDRGQEIYVCKSTSLTLNSFKYFK